MPTLAVIRSFLASGETLEFTVSGGSMGRTLPPGSLVRVAARPPRLGELVLYDYGLGAAVHRAVWRRRDRVYQMGDAQRGGTWLTPGQILGTVTDSRRPGEAWRKEGRLPRAWRLLRGWRRLALRRLRRGGGNPASAGNPDSTGTQGGTN